MGERAILQIAQRLDSGASVRELTNIREQDIRFIKIPKFLAALLSCHRLSSKKKIRNWRWTPQIKYQQQTFDNGKAVIQQQEGGPAIVVMPPAEELDEKTIDEIYALHYEALALEI